MGARGQRGPVDRLQDWVTRQAGRRPEATAVVGPAVDGLDRLSYGELEAASNRLAHLLREAGCRRGDRVGLLVPKSPTAIAAIVGIYKADAVLVPLDTECPAPRLGKILASADCRCLLAAGGDKVATLVAELAAAGAIPERVRLGWLERDGTWIGPRAPDFGRADLASQPLEPPPSRATADDPAHVLFTSGSTGDPKGVVLQHRSVVEFVRWGVDHFGIGEDERLSGHSPLHFDLSTFDVFGAFAAGAELHLVPPELNLLAPRLAELIRGSALTQWFAVPSVLNYMARFEVVEQDDFPALRRLLWCGEVFPTPALAHWMRRLPHVSFTNLYGPTETTVASSVYDVPGVPEDERAPVPIGRPCDGEELLVLGERFEALPAGETGDLFIGGAGLSSGYFREPAKTAAAFLPHPAAAVPGARIYRTGDLARCDQAGRFHFLGRADTQIKSRGYRIELGEIESAVAATGLARETVVTAIPSGGFEGQRICCAYVPAPDRESGPAALRRELGRLLPAYMMPARWQTWERLPRNRNGKLDRRQVRESLLQESAGGGAG